MSVFGVIALPIIAACLGYSPDLPRIPTDETDPPEPTDDEGASA